MEIVNQGIIKILNKQIQNPTIPVLITIIILFILSIPGIKQNIDTLRGTNYELSANQVNEVLDWIEKKSEPSDQIFAPPYFAFLSNRKIVGEFSEQYVWFIKYLNWIRYREGNPKTLIHIEKIGNELSDKKVPIVFLNIERGRGQQTGMIIPIRQAVDNQYEPVGQIRMRNETLTIFLSKN